MANIVWLGEPEGDNEGPRQNVWNGITFKRGEEVEIDNSHMIAKARRNPFFAVDGKTYVPKGASPHPSAIGPVIRDKTDLSEMNVAELREEAARRNIDVDGLSKAEIRERLAET